MEYEKILNQKQLDNMSIKELRLLAIKLGLDYKKTGPMLKRNILLYFRSQFDKGNLYFEYEELSNEKIKELKEKEYKQEKEKRIKAQNRMKVLAEIKKLKEKL